MRLTEGLTTPQTATQPAPLTQGSQERTNCVVVGATCGRPLLPWLLQQTFINLQINVLKHIENNLDIAAGLLFIAGDSVNCDVGGGFVGEVELAC